MTWEPSDSAYSMDLASFRFSSANEKEYISPLIISMVSQVNVPFAKPISAMNPKTSIVVINPFIQHLRYHSIMSCFCVKSIVGVHDESAYSCRQNDDGNHINAICGNARLGQQITAGGTLQKQHSLRGPGYPQISNLGPFSNRR